MPGGRPFSRATKLGQLMYDEGWNVADISVATGIYNRTLTEYLSGRKRIPVHHLRALADALDCEISDIIGMAVPRQPSSRS